MFSNQRDITAGGDVAGRDVVKTNNNFNFSPVGAKTQIALLYERLRAEAVSPNAGVAEIIEDLQHYLAKPARQIERSLEDKLQATGRANIIDFALESKERAMKRIVRFQSSPAAQEIFAYVLGDIHARFNQHVMPLLSAGAGRQAVDTAVYQMVIAPIADCMEPSHLGLNSAQITAMLYCLAGNCHIKWD